MKYVESIAQRVRAAEIRSALFYTKPTDKLYKRLRTLYTVFTAISAITSLLFVAARYTRIEALTAAGLNLDNANHINSLKSTILTVGICAAVQLIALILSFVKLEYLSAPITLLSGTVSCIILADNSTNTMEFNEGINPSFWLRHFIPFLLALLFIVWLVILKARAEIIFRRNYLNLVSYIYKTYHTDDMSDSQWEDFLKEYNPKAEEEKRRREKQKLKKEK